MVRGEYCRRGSQQIAKFGHGKKERGPRDRTFKVHHLRLDLALDFQRKGVSGTSTLTLSPINPGLSSVVLDAVDLKIGRAMVDGSQVDFEHGGGQLTVKLPRSMDTGEKFTLSVDYEASPLKGLFFTGPDEAHPDKQVMAWAQGEAEENRWWFPCYDATNDRMTSEVLITVPSKFTALSNGRLEATKEDAEAGTNTFHWVMDVPHPTYLVTIAAGEFDSVDDLAGKVPIRYHVPRGFKEYIERSFSETPAMMRFFEEATGREYPYAKYDQVCVEDFTAGGMENTTLTILYKETLHSDSAEPDYRSEALVAHELAHQWFGDLITCKSWGDLWLNEGFASYLDPLWTERRWGPEEFEQRMNDDKEGYFEEARENYARPIVIHSYSEPNDMFDAHSYEKGAAVLHMLRYVLGDELFFKALRRYIERYQLSSVETNDFKLAIEEATGRSLDWFFRQWLYKGGHPEYEVSWDWDPEKKLVALTVAQRQKVTDIVPLFQMPIEIELLGLEGEGRHKIMVERAEETFYIPATKRPLAVLFDPKNWILKSVKFQKQKGELLAQLRSATTVSMRAQACEGLGKLVGDAEAADTLRQTLAEHSFWGTRVAAAKALGAHGSKEAFDVLSFNLRRDADSRVRRALAEALGEFPRKEAFDILRESFPNEPKDYPAASMVKAAARTRASGLFEWLSTEPFKRASHMEVVARSALEGLASLRDKRGIAACASHLEYGEAVWKRQTAAGALGQLGGVLEDQRQEVRELLAPLLKDREFRVRRAAANALGKTKDPASIPLLEAVEEGEVFGHVRKAARHARENIVEAQAAKGQSAEMQKLMDELREADKELKVRLAKVEAQLAGGRKRRSKSVGVDRKVE